MEPGMDFHQAFQAIDTDHSGEISIEELESYCKKNNYKDTFVKKWLNLFDEDQNGTITYEEYCNTLGLVPKQDVVEKHKDYQTQQATGGSGTQASAGKKPQKGASDSKSGGRSRNVVLSGSLMKFSRARMFQRKAIYRLKRKSSGGATTSAKGDSTKATTLTEKPVGGDKNGGKRLVPSRRTPSSLQTNQRQRKAQLRPKKCFKDHKRRLRASIRPGTVLILLAGRHRGKRVVFLKQLASGLLLVTGPLKANGCPLRRVAQSFVIATKTRIEVGDVQVPERVNDMYFRRRKQLEKRSAARSESELFARQKLTYQLTQERKEDQKAVDSQLMGAIKRAGDGKLFISYLRSLFSLKNGQKPHDMIF